MRRRRTFLRVILLFLVLVIIFIASREEIITRVMMGRPRNAVQGEVVVKTFNFENKNSIKGWEEKALVDKKTDYTPAEYKGKSCIKAVSEDSASALFFKQKLFYDKRPYVSWDWLVEKFPKHKNGESLEAKKEYDFAAQIYVVFYSRFFLKRKAIQYVWAEELPVGEVANSPFTVNVKVMVLESGPSDGWKSEERNIREDYENLFGGKLEKDVDAIAFMTDSDSTDSSAVAYYTDIVLKFGGPYGEGAGNTGRKSGIFDSLLDWLSSTFFTKEGKKEEPSNT